jgi:putative redox protein
VGDLIAAANWLAQTRQPPAILIGHSLGGAAVLAAAADLPYVKAVCTIGAPSDPDHVKHNFSAHIEQIESTGSADVELAGRSFTISKQFLDDISSQSLEKKISNMKKALLVFHAPLDATVSIDNASRIYQAAKHPKSFISLDNADHLLTKRNDAEYVANIITAWLKNYIEHEDIKHHRSLSREGEVVVKETGEGSFSQVVSMGNTHIMRADEPLSMGGDDTGPGPYDLLLAGLGACTSMTLRMYANRKKWPLETVEVSLRHSKIHSQDCADCDSLGNKLDHIDRQLTLTGSLDDEQRARLLEIADKCPVHKTLHSPVTINTSLTEDN